MYLKFVCFICQYLQLLFTSFDKNIQSRVVNSSRTLCLVKIAVKNLKLFAIPQILVEPVQIKKNTQSR